MSYFRSFTVCTSKYLMYIKCGVQNVNSIQASNTSNTPCCCILLCLLLNPLHAELQSVHEVHSRYTQSILAACPGHSLRIGCIAHATVIADSLHALSIDTTTIQCISTDCTLGSHRRHKTWYDNNFRRFFPLLWNTFEYFADRFARERARCPWAHNSAWVLTVAFVRF